MKKKGKGGNSAELKEEKVEERKLLLRREGKLQRKNRPVTVDQKKSLREKYLLTRGNACV